MDCYGEGLEDCAGGEGDVGGESGGFVSFDIFSSSQVFIFLS